MKKLRGARYRAELSNRCQITIASTMNNPMRIKEPRPRFNRWDLLVARVWWGANCGPTALAAILGIRLGDVRRLVPETTGGIGVNLMKTALTRAGCCWQLTDELPANGLAVIRFDGPWERHEAPGHWIAVSNGKVADAASINDGEIAIFCGVLLGSLPISPFCGDSLCAVLAAGVLGGFVVGAAVGGWRDSDYWWRRLAPRLAPKKATGTRIEFGIEVSRDG